MIMGALFILDNTAVIDIGGPSDCRARRAVDGNRATRWSWAFSDSQWIRVDPGGSHEVARVRLIWEAACAREYLVRVSSDGSSWTTVADVTDGDGEIDQHELNANARYVQVVGRKRGTPWGYSIRDFEMYGPDGSLLSARTDCASPSIASRSGGRLRQW